MTLERIVRTVQIDNDVLGKFANEKLKIKVYLFLFRSSSKLCVEQTPVDEKNEGREKTILKSCKFYYWKNLVAMVGQNTASRLHKKT